MFEREQLRCKLLDGRVEEIKLKRKTEAVDEKKAYVKRDEDIINPDDPEEFLRIITRDTEFKDVLNTFQDQVYKVDKKRQEREYVMEQTDFEADFEPSEIDVKL